MRGEEGDATMVDSEKFQKIIDEVRLVCSGNASSAEEADVIMTALKPTLPGLNDEDRKLIERVVSQKRSGKF